MSFEADLEAFARAVKQSLDATCRGIAIEWFSSTVLGTPVDTGRLRGNWQMSQHVPIEASIERMDKSGASVLADIAARVGGAGSINYLTNNLPYAERIEYGYSKQAPQGMVRINFARITHIIEQVARGNAV